MKKVKDLLVNMFNGFCMAMADSVPGVSGGTIAFLLGFYDKFISSLDDLFRGSLEKKKEALIFLIKLGLGWGIGFCVCATILSSLFSTKIYAMSSLFIGFILFAIPLVIKEEMDSVKGKYKNIIFLIIGIALVVLVSVLTNFTGLDIDISKLNLITIIYIFVAAMISISAMVLPGISGSTLLLVFGLYIPIMTRIKAFLSFDFSVVPVLVIFGLGIIAGIVFFVGLIRKCLNKYRSQTVYMIIGMMIGSLYSIVLGPTTLEVPQAILSLENFDFLFFIIGGVIIIALELVKKFINKTS